MFWWIAISVFMLIILFVSIKNMNKWSHRAELKRRNIAAWREMQELLPQRLQNRKAGTLSNDEIEMIRVTLKVGGISASKARGIAEALYREREGDTSGWYDLLGSSSTQTHTDRAVLSQDEKKMDAGKTEDARNEKEKYGEERPPSRNKKHSTELDRALELYDGLLSKMDSHSEEARAVAEFFIPDRVDPEAYVINQKVIMNNPAWLFHEDHPKLSPSALDIAKGASSMPPGYPSWFVCGYPDVFLWCSKGDGADMLEERYFDDLTEKEFLDGGHIKHKFLREIIDAYKEAGNQLEAFAAKSY